MSRSCAVTPRLLRHRLRRDTNRTRRDADYSRLILIEQTRLCANQADDDNRARDERAYQRLRDAFVQEKMPLAQAYARRWRQRGIELEDLVQVAMLGLIKAVDRWRSEFANRGFSGYALLWMREELQQFLRREATAVHVQYRLHRRAELITRVERRLPQGYTLSDLCTATGLSEAQIAEAKAAPCKLYQAEPLNPLYRDHYDGGRQDLELDRHQETGDEYENALLLRLDAVRMGPLDLDADAEDEAPTPSPRPTPKLRQAIRRRAAAKDNRRPS